MPAPSRFGSAASKGRCLSILALIISYLVLFFARTFLAGFPNGDYSFSIPRLFWSALFNVKLRTTTRAIGR